MNITRINQKWIEQILNIYNFWWNIEIAARFTIMIFCLKAIKQNVLKYTVFIEQIGLNKYLRFIFQRLQLNLYTFIKC